MQFDPTTDCAKYNIVATLKNASLDNFQLFVKKKENFHFYWIEKLDFQLRSCYQTKQYYLYIYLLFLSFYV